ncbi:MAG: DUF1772 domain-containing protein [Bacteroidota bacterium]
MVFFGSMVPLSIASIYEFNSNKAVFWLMLAAYIVYFLGTVGVTSLGNVPLNNQLDALNLSELSQVKMAEFRSFYEQKWNRLHLIRTIFAVLAFMLSIAALLFDKK